MGDRAESMEQHGDELDDQDEGEEKDEHQPDGLELQVLLADVDLPNVSRVICQFSLGCNAVQHAGEKWKCCAENSIPRKVFQSSPVSGCVSSTNGTLQLADIEQRIQRQQCFCV